MAATIRLMRFGKRGFATYRVIVVERKSKRNGSFIENIGTYNPHIKNKAGLVLKKERLAYWKSVGATYSEGLGRIIGKNK